MYKVPRKKMKAAILTKLNTPLLIEEVSLPSTLEYGQVFVKLLYTSICGSQIGEVSGIKGEDHYLPHLLGHEGVGVVEALGPGVNNVKLGDHVVLHWKKGQGIEAPPPKYQWKGKALNAGWVTTFNEYAIVAENRLTTIPQDFDPELATLLGCAVTTGIGVISHDANLKIGESLLVLGAGGVGLSVIQGGAMTSAHPIIAVDIVDDKLALAKKLGATHCINSKDKDLAAEVKKIVGEEGCDVVVENTGHIALIEKAYELAKRQGRTVLVGVPRAGEKASISSLPLHFGKTLTGSHGGGSCPNVEIPRYIQLHKAGKLRLKEMISNRLPFEKINEAFDLMRSSKVVGRCLLKFCTKG